MTTTRYDERPYSAVLEYLMGSQLVGADLLTSSVHGMDTITVCTNSGLTNAKPVRDDFP
jgi:hypothetical protein